jgi:SAM-dependent methyltransferase
MHNTGKNIVSTIQLADSIVARMKPKLSRFKTEADLKIAFEKILEPVSKELGIKYEPKYEKSIYHAQRADALHGQVVIEYEAPYAFRSQRWIKHAFEQLVSYIQGLSEETKETLFETKFVGVGFDGEKIFFVNYVGDRKPKTKLNVNDFAIRGPYDFTTESARTLITYLRTLARIPLTAENLAERFSPQSEVARDTVSAFVDALMNWSAKRPKVFFEEWKRLFGIVYGEQFAGAEDKKHAVLAEIYGLEKSADFQTILFCVHTYFALLMKLIAAEIVSIGESGFNASFTGRLVHGSDEQLFADLTEIENGGIYQKRGITNFLEGDFFRWYLEAMNSPRLRDALRAVARTLSDFEPATTTIRPEVTRDLLKKLYQYLVPDVVRHHLGEYYTPDWLAELVLNEAGYRGDTRKRLLDPACGSGTFLVLAIQRARAFAEKNNKTATETAQGILRSVWGFDLNPLAVIASRTNYLFALGDIAGKLSSFEIPVYLADSVLWPKRSGQMLLGVDGAVEVPTSVGTFQVPKIWVDDPSMMRRAAPVIEQLAKIRCNTSEVLEHLKKEGLVFQPHEKVVIRFYEHILGLEQEGRNGIWARFLKNVFAPMIAGNFDFVVGNPPWIRWGYLSNEYRKATMEMWQDYGLFSLKGHAARLGGGEKDFSMLFTYAAADHYLCRNGKLGFLITQEVFKSKGAGEGFRKFRLGAGDSLMVTKAHDLVSVQPFEGAANKTSAIFLTKGRVETRYPVPYIVWKRKKGVGRIPTNLKLKDAVRLLEREELEARPIGKSNGSWKTLKIGDKRLNKIEGENAYQARLGARVEPYGVFWLDVRQILSGGDLIVRNLVEKGKRRIKKIEERIEADLVYPAVRGSDIERWQAKPGIYILMVQNPEKSEPYSEHKMKKDWPYTYNYLSRFKDVLLSRGSRTVRELAERTAFYAMFGIGKYTVARYKVVWKRMAGDLVASVISQEKTSFGWKTIIPTDTTSIFATDNENEAHYLCAIINSTYVRKFIKSFSSAGRGFGTPSVMENVGIQKFDLKNSLHQKLADISKRCHQMKSENKDNEVAHLEKENDDLVKKLFGI